MKDQLPIFANNLIQIAGVDAHSGVEDESGRKCRQRVEKFIAEAQAGFRLMADGTYG